MENVLIFIFKILTIESTVAALIWNLDNITPFSLTQKMLNNHGSYQFTVQSVYVD